MNQMDAIYPEYAFASHKGYATAIHRRQLQQHGPCPLHRRSFAPVGNGPWEALDPQFDVDDLAARDLDLDLAETLADDGAVDDGAWGGAFP